ncbi:MAG: SIS domain-containing protein [Ignavibacteria bacterium GWA2_55_11]|nr:MAG: SIS domain-containing protein [Ignavibacteria bacterium GWA2_55_11]OGU45879.1 MAG: SIS domain-containing protein [Ignavibacteria bacterium GWC2_56_12]OGU64677.1 MAG: SIS domain-containing protein [Ignavibacteria bacterium RIFCSPHIGHO2_02_FULL_56_12]OGU71661.1 MAG: SIS domain-containing protein [Ignavibacteria bacterium RIFCSPLOWO2_02_FULL_55_14]OGU72657.1 MAG: SIS domain-containing protein [Ignavibacteria bacterium RIFCSPLOWO2_12_FULL_56_21]
MLSQQWLSNVRNVMDRIERTQLDNIRSAASVMADSIQAGRWVHTFGCGHATLPIEEMYPRIGGFVGFHPIIELPLTFFTRVTGEMGIHQFLFLERAEGYGVEIMKAYTFDRRDTMWIFSHTGINNVNIDVALEAKKRGMKVIVSGSAQESAGKKTRHSCGKTLFEVADIVIDSCTPLQDASVSLENHRDKVGPVSTMAFVTVVWMTITTVAEILAGRGVKLSIHPSHNIPGDTTARERLNEALVEYKRRVAGV